MSWKRHYTKDVKWLQVLKGNIWYIFLGELPKKGGLEKIMTMKAHSFRR